MGNNSNKEKIKKKLIILLAAIVLAIAILIVIVLLTDKTSNSMVYILFGIVVTVAAIEGVYISYLKIFADSRGQSSNEDK